MRDLKIELPDDRDQQATAALVEIKRHGINPRRLIKLAQRIGAAGGSITVGDVTTSS